VGKVGAVGEKAAAAQRADADLFFVPIAQRAEAKRAAPNVEVVGVRSLDDAVRTLNGAGCRR
jgi:PDZ domain-containing protein